MLVNCLALLFFSFHSMQLLPLFASGCNSRSYPPFPPSRNPKGKSATPTYLILHNRLLKPRALHSNRPRLLAPAPRPLVIGRLLRAQLLALHYALLEDFVEGALGRQSRGIGLGDVRLGVALDGVVGGHLVDGGGGGRVGAVEGEAADGAAGAERAGEHCARGCEAIEGRWEGDGRDASLSFPCLGVVRVSQRGSAQQLLGGWECYIHHSSCVNRFGEN